MIQIEYEPVSISLHYECIFSNASSFDPRMQYDMQHGTSLFDRCFIHDTIQEVLVCCSSDSPNRRAIPQISVVVQFFVCRSSSKKKKGASWPTGAK